MAPKIMKNKYSVERTLKELPVDRVGEVTAMVEGETRQRDITKARRYQYRDLARLRRLLRIRTLDPDALAVLVERCLDVQATIKRRGAAIGAKVRKLDTCLADLKDKTKKRLCEESFAKFLLHQAQVIEKRELRKDEETLQAMILGDQPEYEIDEELRGKAGYFVVFGKAVDSKGEIAGRLEGSCLFMYE